MRIYIPATLPMLRKAVSDGEFCAAQGIGFAVTDELRSEYPGADTEDLEYLAMNDAALASLRLIAADGAEPVRVVISIDADGGVSTRADLDRAVVKLEDEVSWRKVAAVHLDGGDVADTVARAVRMIAAADLEDTDAMLAVGDAEDIDLAWYAPEEIGYLLTELGAP